MSDERLREAERRWNGSGSVEHEGDPGVSPGLVNRSVAAVALGFAQGATLALLTYVLVVRRGAHLPLGWVAHAGALGGTAGVLHLIGSPSSRGWWRHVALASLCCTVCLVGQVNVLCARALLGGADLLGAWSACLAALANPTFMVLAFFGAIPLVCVGLVQGDCCRARIIGVTGAVVGSIGIAAGVKAFEGGLTGYGWALLGVVFPLSVGVVDLIITFLLRRLQPTTSPDCQDPA